MTGFQVEGTEGQESMEQLSTPWDGVQPVCKFTKFSSYLRYRYVTQETGGGLKTKTAN